MEEYKRQAGGQINSSDPQQITPPPSSAMGMMQLPGRRSYPGLDLVHGAGAVSDSTYEATVLGELAVISIEQEVRVTIINYDPYIVTTAGSLQRSLGIQASGLCREGVALSHCSNVRLEKNGAPDIGLY